MKKYLKALIVLFVIGGLSIVGASSVMAADGAYAVYDSLNETLTFKVADLTADGDTIWAVGDGSNARDKWVSKNASVTEVIFDDSFAGYTQLQTTEFWFSSFTNLTTITSLTNLKTASVTTMNRMFNGCSSLKTIDLTSFDTLDLTIITYMFNGCSSLKTIDFTSFETLSVTKMSYMFNGCTSLETLDLSSFNTYNVIGMSYMFNGCSSLQELDLSSFNTASVKNTKCMFCGCTSLETLDLSSFKTSNVTNMSHMFNGCSSLQELDLSSFNTASVTNMARMFYGCKLLETIYASDDFITTSVTSHDSMFQNCTKLTGGYGTTLASTSKIVDKTYAKIDKSGQPGYFTEKIAYAVATGSTLTFYYNGGYYIGIGSEYTEGTNKWLVGDGSNVYDKWDKSPIYDNTTEVIFDDSFRNYDGVRTTVYWFCEFSKLTTVTSLTNLNTSNVIDMNNMFYGCSSLTTLAGIDKWDTSSVTNTSLMFYKCLSLKELNLSGWDTSNVTQMQSMFAVCSSLTTIYVSDKFVTDAETSSDDMFNNCNSLVGGNGTNYDLNNTDKTYAKIDGLNGASGYFSLSTKTDIAYAVAIGPKLTFYYDKKFNNVDHRGTKWLVGTGSDLYVPYFEYYKWLLSRTDITEAIFDDSFASYTELETTAYWFYDFDNLTTVTSLTNLKTSNVTNMRDMFDGCSSLQELDLSNFNTSSVVSMVYMFSDCSSLVTITGLDKWDTSSVNYMQTMFNSCISLKELDLSDWDTSNVEDMTFMFMSCSSLTTITGIDKWDTSSVSYLQKIFYGCSSLKELDLSSWDTSNVEYMYNIFYGCTSLKELNLNNWDTSSVTDMSGMFAYCSSLEILDLSSFDTASVTCMYDDEDCPGMFASCTSLTTIYVSDKFVTTGITDPALGIDVFVGCTSLVGGNVTTYDSNNTDKTYAKIDKEGQQGYFTEKLTITIETATQTYIYNGLLQNFEVTGTKIPATSSFVINYYVESTWTEIAPINAGTYEVSITRLDSGAYYAFATLSSIKISPKPVTLTVININSGITYDGTAKTTTATYTDLTGTDTATYTLLYSDNTNAGTCEVTISTATIVSGTPSNYSFDISATGTIIIEKKEIGFEWGNTDFVYDGLTSYCPVATATGLCGNDVCTLTIIGKNLNAGNYFATVTDLSNNNYKLPTVTSKAFYIGKITIAVPGSDTTVFIYNGELQTYVLATNTNYTISGTTTKLDAGTNTITVTLNNTDDYAWSGGSSATLLYDFVIYPKPVTVTVINPIESFTYDGTSKTTIATYTGLIGDGELAYSLSYSDNINAGTCVVSIVSTTLLVETPTNFNVISSATGSIIITPKDATVTVIDPTSAYTYDGRNKTADATVAGLVGTDTATYTLLYNGSKNSINAGTYVVSISTATTVKGISTNYNFNISSTGTVIVNKAKVDEPAVSGTCIYTGELQKPEILGKKSFMTESGAVRAVDIGDYTIYYTLDNNHEWNDGSDGIVTWSIDKAKSFFDWYRRNNRVAAVTSTDIKTSSLESKNEEVNTTVVTTTAPTLIYDVTTETAGAKVTNPVVSNNAGDSSAIVKDSLPIYLLILGITFVGLIVTLVLYVSFKKIV